MGAPTPTMLVSSMGKRITAAFATYKMPPERMQTFAKLVDPGCLPDCKNFTNALEDELAASGQYSEARPLNLDPDRALRPVFGALADLRGLLDRRLFDLERLAAAEYGQCRHPEQAYGASRLHDNSFR